MNGAPPARVKSRRFVLGSGLTLRAHQCHHPLPLLSHVCHLPTIQRKSHRTVRQKRPCPERLESSRHNPLDLSDPSYTQRRWPGRRKKLGVPMYMAKRGRRPIATPPRCIGLSKSFGGSMVEEFRLTASRSAPKSSPPRSRDPCRCAKTTSPADPAQKDGPVFCRRCDTRHCRPHNPGELCTHMTRRPPKASNQPNPSTRAANYVSSSDDTSCDILKVRRYETPRPLCPITQVGGRRNQFRRLLTSVGRQIQPLAANRSIGR
mmetsp:Transcript_96724/g.189982  ORF Transcript_96724/g.189982 Transcript_96724/m.189982 type:complete len:262 (+) Transcript_96724:112-897(+)